MPTLGPSAISGACAGLVSSIVTCPLDVVKTKLQAQTKGSRNAASSSTSGSASAQAASTAPTASTTASQTVARQLGKGPAAGEQPPVVYRGLVGTLRTIYRNDGIRGFYRGLGPTIFGYLPTWAIYFTVYDGCKEFLASRGGTRQRAEEDFLNHILSALTAGGASTICTSPLWVVKTRFMLQSTKPTSPDAPQPYKHTLDAFVRIMQTEGPRGFYRGLLPSLMGVSHVAVQFPLYENFKSWARESPLALVTEGGDRELPAQVILLCSSTAKMIASVLTYPHEVVRTRLQMQPRAKADRNPPPATASSSYAGSGNRGQSGEMLQGSVDSRRPYSTRAMLAMTRRQSSAAEEAWSGRHSTVSRIAGSSATARRTLFHHSRTAASDNNPALKYSGVIKTVRTIFAEEGLGGFYNGMGVNLVRTVPSSALTILTYEVMMSHFTSPSRAQQQRNNDGDNEDG